MLFPIVILPLLAAAASSDAKSKPIMVTGHAWAPFISPMGEPFRARTATDDTLARWFNQVDRNRDGLLTQAELVADADRFFATLDSDGDGEITPEELIHYEWETAPDIQVNSRLQRRPGEAAPPKRPDNIGQDTDGTRPRRGKDDPDAFTGGLQGAARYGLLNMPEPVAAADADFNRAISRAEFEQAAIARFQLLDRDHRGVLTLAGLESQWTAVLATLHDRKRRRESTDTRVGAPLPSDR